MSQTLVSYTQNRVAGLPWQRDPAVFDPALHFADNISVMFFVVLCYNNRQSINSLYAAVEDNCTTTQSFYRFRSTA